MWGSRRSLPRTALILWPLLSWRIGTRDLETIDAFHCRVPGNARTLLMLQWRSGFEWSMIRQRARGRVDLHWAWLTARKGKRRRRMVKTLDAWKSSGLRCSGLRGVRRARSIWRLVVP